MSTPTFVRAGVAEYAIFDQSLFAVVVVGSRWQEHFQNVDIPAFHFDAAPLAAWSIAHRVKLPGFPGSRPTFRVAVTIRR